MGKLPLYHIDVEYSVLSQWLDIRTPHCTSGVILTLEIKDVDRKSVDAANGMYGVL